jgi:ribosomal protein S18 acetylase RimI-like enzyme
MQVIEVHNEHDLCAVIDLRYEILRAPWGQEYETSTDGFEKNSVNALLRDENGEPLACGRLQEIGQWQGQIRYMAVKESGRGKGFGRMVLRFLESRARDRHLKKIMLQARENALAFYEKEGYRLVEKSFLLWDKIQHYRMEKDI